MIVLDTNVVSEPTKANLDIRVLQWLDAQEPQTLFLTATSLSELLTGIEQMPAGKRRTHLRAGVDTLIGKLFGERVLPFDSAAAQQYSRLVTKARAKGCVVSMGDGQIAAIAASKGFAVATRDTEPFLAMGLVVINPWTFS